MPWVPVDIHVAEQPEMEEAGELGGIAVFAVRDELWRMAKSQAKGGKVAYTYRVLSTRLHAEPEVIVGAIKALLSAGVLTCPEESERGAVVAFDSKEWKRLNGTAQKAAKRAEQKEAEAHE